jgi:hypothetical protein
MFCSTTNVWILRGCAFVGGVGALSAPFLAIKIVDTTKESWQKILLDSKRDTAGNDRFWYQIFDVRSFFWPKEYPNHKSATVMAAQGCGSMLLGTWLAHSSWTNAKEARRLVRAGGVSLYGPIYQSSCCYHAQFGARLTLHAVAAAICAPGAVVYFAIPLMCLWRIASSQ